MKNVVELIGNTPVVELGSVSGNRLYAKLEYMNPTGSIKDRAAYYMVKEAIARGELARGGAIVEPTSGNTGIGLAMVCRAYGIGCTIVMPANMSRERIAMIRAYGAEIVLTDASLGMQGAVSRAREISETNGAYMPCQFDNKDNIKAHVETTAREIFEAYPDVKWVVSPLGSGGTAMGIKQYIVDNGIDAKICAVEPASSPLMTKGFAGAHKIQGIGANFVPSIVDVAMLDKIVCVTDDEAYEGARSLAREAGIFGGISAGASYKGALRLLEEETGDVLFIVPDSGARYMSTDLYD